MSLNNIFSYFVPQDKKFFPLFEQAGENLVTMSLLFKERLSKASTPEASEITKEIDRLEGKGDNITHQIHLELGKNFITPFDREDIHSLAN